MADPSPRPWKAHSAYINAHVKTIKLTEDEIAAGKAPWSWLDLPFTDDHGRTVGEMAMWTIGEAGGWPKVDTEEELRANLAYMLRAVNAYDDLLDLCRGLLNVAWICECTDQGQCEDCRLHAIATRVLAQDATLRS